MGIRNKARGFTLIELMVAVAVVAILASIALPSYTRYLIRARLADVGSTLPVVRAQMEQFHQDYRRYTATAGGTACGVNAPVVAGFVLSCIATTDQSFVWTMTATSGGAAPARFTIDHQNTRATLAWPQSWGPVPAAGASEWLLRGN